MRFPAACAAVIVASGVLVVHAFPSACGLFLMAGLPASIGLWIWGRSQLRRNITGLAALTFAASGGIALFSGSALNYSSTLAPGFNNLSRWSRPHNPMILTVTGRLQSKARSRSGRVSYEIDVRSMVFGRLFRDVRGRILIQDWDNASVLDYEVVHPGDLIRTTGELFALSGPRNPFDFDAATFHRRNGISSGFTSAGIFK